MSALGATKIAAPDRVHWNVALIYIITAPEPGTSKIASFKGGLAGKLVDVVLPTPRKSNCIALDCSLSVLCHSIAPVNPANGGQRRHGHHAERKEESKGFDHGRCWTWVMGRVNNASCVRPDSKV